MSPKIAVKGAAKAKKAQVKFTIDCAQPVRDSIFDVANFEKFLHERVKVAGKTGNLGDKVAISADQTMVSINAETPFSKRYLKYLTKKYLKKNQLRDWMHVIATSPTAYVIKYYNINQDEEDEE